MPDENAKTYNSIFGRHLLVIDDDKNKLSIWMQIKFFYRNHCRCGLKVYSACLRMYVILFLLLFSDLCSSPSLNTDTVYISSVDKIVALKKKCSQPRW